MKKLGQPMFATKAEVAAGGFGALSLGELLRASKPVAKHVCQVHRWRESKYSRTCSRCGFVEDKDRG